MCTTTTTKLSEFCVSCISVMVLKRIVCFCFHICSIISHPCTHTLMRQRKDHSLLLDTLMLSPDGTNEAHRANMHIHRRMLTSTVRLQKKLHHKCLKESNHSSIHHQQQPSVLIPPQSVAPLTPCLVVVQLWGLSQALRE